jgi:excisionase family DNA binding protein
MENVVMSIIPLKELEAQFGKVVEEKIKQIFTSSFQSKEYNYQEYATRREIAEKLRISLPTLNNYTKDETLKGYRIGGRVLYKWSEVESALSQISSTKYKRKK